MIHRSTLKVPGQHSTFILSIKTGLKRFRLPTDSGKQEMSHSIGIKIINENHTSLKQHPKEYVHSNDVCYSWLSSHATVEEIGNMLLLWKNTLF